MLALVITYEFNKSQIVEYGFQGIIEGIGFSSGSFALLIFVLIISGMIYLIVKFARESLLIIGGSFYYWVCWLMKKHFLFLLELF